MIVRVLLPPSRKFVVAVAVIAALGAVGAFGAASVLATSTQVAPPMAESTGSVTFGATGEPVTGGHPKGGCPWGDRGSWF